MDETFVYDKAKYHYEGDFPADLNIEQGFIHTGMFLGWIIDHDLYSEWFGKELGEYVADFKARKLTGARVFEACDGVFTSDMLNEEGNSFAQEYFDFTSGIYLRDYGKLLGEGLPTVYHVEDTWGNYDKLKHRVDKRYRDWKRKRASRWKSLLSKLK